MSKKASPIKNIAKSVVFPVVFPEQFQHTSMPPGTSANTFGVNLNIETSCQEYSTRKLIASDTNIYLSNICLHPNVSLTQ